MANPILHFHGVRPASEASFRRGRLPVAGRRLRVFTVEDRTPARIKPVVPGRPDWNNDYQRFVLDLSDRLKSVADEKGRAVVLRRLRRALDPDDVPAVEGRRDANVNHGS
ncbi:hypothetical protein [Rhizobium leguminosarum]|uniref:hypothetical protein n=1 Tax=Rhizobium leguminosarum TaxID=384 RepID=UPI0039658B19